MRGPRFSIGTLLSVIAILGVAMAALRNPSYLWAALTFTTALLAVIAAIASAIVARAERRAYWLGFSLFGGTYLAICTMPGLHDAVCPRLATEALFDFIYPLMAPADPAPPVVPQFISTGTVSLPQFTIQPVSPPPATLPTMPGTPNLVWPDDPYTVPNPNYPTPWTAPIAPAPLPYYTFTMNTVVSSPPVGRWAAWTQPDRTIGVGYTIGTVSLVSSEAFRRIGHSLAALLLATLGAAFARNRYEAHARRQSTPDETPRAYAEPSFHARISAPESSA
jgi:hypothetical protein